MQKPKLVHIYLEEILQCIEDVQSFVAGYTKTSFIHDKKTQAAVVRNIEVIGEIVKRLPLAIKTEAPNIPWKQIAGMRDILIHDYASVDVHETWIVATADIPKLKRNIEKLKRELKNT